jgi:hypothetical protein
MEYPPWAMWAPRIQKLLPSGIEMPVRSSVFRQVTIIIIFERLPCKLDLALVTHTYHGFGFGFGFGQYRQQHGGEDAYNGDHHQELNESEASGF